MLLKCTLLEEEEHTAKRAIERLQRDRDSGAITEDEFEDKYETVMQNLRLRFSILMDGRSLESYNTYKNGNS